MATRIFPIFRGLQRAIVGSAGIGKYEPTLAATARHLQGKEGETKEEDTEVGSEEKIVLIDGHRLYSHDENDDIILDNPSTWPINSEKARQLRREFVQEGFRKLCKAASSQFAITATIGDIGVDENEDNNGIERDGREAIEAELGHTADGVPNSAVNEDETAQHAVGTEDWLYYAQ